MVEGQGWANNKPALCASIVGHRCSQRLETLAGAWGAC